MVGCDARAPQDLPSDKTKALPEAALTGLLCDYAARGDISAFRSLIHQGADVNSATPYDLRTPLHLAAAAGKLDMVKFLVEDCGAALRQDRFGLLPIHDAVENGHSELRRYLQSQKLAEPKNMQKRRRLDSGENINSAESRLEQEMDDLMGTVFELVVKEGVFSYTSVHAEVLHFFKVLRFHEIYFRHFTPLQIAKHVHCLIAAKHVARATDDIGGLEFDFKTSQSGFFLSTIGSCREPTGAQMQTIASVSAFVTNFMEANQNVSLIFMSSEGPVFIGGQEKLGIYSVETGHFEATRVTEGESSLEVLASSRFLKTKTREAKEQYQIVMEDVVASRRSAVRIVPGHLYPGPCPFGYVVLFATAETVGRHYLPEIWQAMRFVGLLPRRFYFENFANGVITYSLFFPSATDDQVHKLKRTIMHATLLKETPGRSALLYNNVMQSRISHECGLYLLAAVKFVHAFFPKEQYSREYTGVHKVLEQNPAAQRKLETLYRLCMKDLLSTERIYQLISKRPALAEQFYADFRKIALGEIEPTFNKELGTSIDAACSDPQDRQILRMFLTFNESVLLTNFFKPDIPGAFAFRLNPAVALKQRPASLYPEVPYGIYMICGRDFMGFHTRFRDVARGGIRLILSRDKAMYERNFATLFDECYNLAYTQQNKNKDIPEGGAKGVILPDSCWSGRKEGDGNALIGMTSQGPAAMRSCFINYVNALLDCMQPEQNHLYSGHMKKKAEILFFGPDENTAGFMDLGADIARERAYPYWKSLTTGKSVSLGGVPHDTYAMTTTSVHTYVTELLRELGEDECSITKFQTGGPDGDLGSNEILVSKDKTIAIVDGSGVVYDPHGIDRAELRRLAKMRVPISQFNRSMLKPEGFLVTVEETDVALPDGSKYLTGAELRDSFHLSPYATADLFVPCGGRPNSITTDNVKKLFHADGVKPKFRMIVEGANLFLSDGARVTLENSGVHVFKDASTNKGGVNSSSLEVFAGLALLPEEHNALMCYNPRTGQAPQFYQDYVRQIQEIIIENAKKEFKAIWECNKQGIKKVDATRLISSKITQMQDAIMVKIQDMGGDERDQLVRSVLAMAIPPLMLQKQGIEGLLKTVPSNYVSAIVGAWVASRFVYS
ncbi:Glutamate dehydrogenase 2 (NAD-specific glutamate dehydrogenase) (NAD-GDH), partial [Durusdinium trenchii]